MVLRFRSLAFAGSLVAHPLLIMAYWLLYPAYGLLHAADIARAIAGQPGMATAADACAYAGVFLAVPATIAVMHVLERPSPRLAFIGGTLSLAGWIALVGVLMGDVVAIHRDGGGPPSPRFLDFYDHLMNDPFILALNAMALLHVIGAVVLGVGLYRTQIVPRWAGILAIIAPPIHLGSNFAGRLWIDVAAWVAIAAVGVCVARLVLRGEPRPTD